MANESNGSMWVSGTYLHWMNASNTQFRFLGTAGSSPAGALPGSIWIAGNTIHYIDSTGVDRTVSGPFVASRSGVGALAGSMWIENNYAPSSTKGQLHFIGAAQDENWAHLDTAFSSSHTDAPFSNSHADNNTYYNGHTDYYSNSFNSNHTDRVDYSSNDFADAYYGHGDNHSDDYISGHTDTYSDPYYNSHSDTAFSSSHTDVAHVDNPTTV